MHDRSVARYHGGFANGHRPERTRNRCQPRGSPSRASTFSPAAAIQTPDLSILSDEFLLDERQLEKKNLALEALRKPLVKRLQRKYGYPPDLQDVAVRTVLQQAEVLSASWQPAHSRA